MKKTAWAAAVVALGAAGYTGASWWFGQQIEQHHAAELDRAIPLLGTGDVVSRDYDRGWFSSQARTVIEFEIPEDLFGSMDGQQPASPDAEPAMRTVRLHLQDDVRHGPLPGWRLAAATIASRLTEVEGIDDATRKAFAAASAPSMSSVFGFDGRFDGEFVLPAGEMRHPQVRVQWDRFDLQVSGNTDADQVQGRMRWPQITLTSEANPARSAVAVQMLLRGLSGEFTARQPRDQPTWFAAQGDFKGRVDEVSFRHAAAGGAPAPAPLLAMSGITLDSKSALDGALLNMRLQMAAQGSLAGLKIDALQFDSALERLDTQAIATLQDAMPTPAETVSSAGDAQAQAATGEAIEQLLAANPAYTTRLAATIGDQQGEIGYRLAVPAAAIAPSDRAMVESPERLLALLSQRLEGEANVRLPKSWIPAIADVLADPTMTAASLNAMLNGLVRQRLLVEEPQAWRTDLKLARGSMLLNGKPFTGLVPGR